MEEQKRILYEFQLLSLETGRGGFSTTTDLLVRSGQIPPYNSSMSNELIAKYISEYIVNNWDKTDVDRAVRDATNALPTLNELKRTQQEKQKIKEQQIKKYRNQQIIKGEIQPTTASERELKKSAVDYNIMRREQTTNLNSWYAHNERKKQRNLTPMERWKLEKGGKRRKRTNKKRTRKNKSRKLRK